MKKWISKDLFTNNEGLMLGIPELQCNTIVEHSIHFVQSESLRKSWRKPILQRKRY